MRLPFLPRRVRVAIAASVTFSLTFASLLAPANHASAPGETVVSQPMKLLARND